MSIFRAFILTHFNYCALVWHFCGATNTKKLERIQCRALRFVFLDFNSDYTTLLVRAGLPTRELARKREILVEVYKAVMHLSPPFMWGVFTQKLTRYNLRNSNQLNIPHSNTTKYGLTYSYGTPCLATLSPVLKLVCKHGRTFPAHATCANDCSLHCVSYYDFSHIYLFIFIYLFIYLFILS